MMFVQKARVLMPAYFVSSQNKKAQRFRDAHQLQLTLNGPAVAVLDGKAGRPHQCRAQVARPAACSQLAEHQQHEHQRVAALILGGSTLLCGQKQHCNAGDAEHDQFQPRKIHAAQHGKAAQHGIAAAASRKKYQVLRVNLSFIVFLPPAAVRRLLTKFSKN